METNDSNIKPQQTGGLKLMTVFIVVLALHVVVIGGFTVYHLMSGGSADADLITTDKTHKGVKGADGPAVADGTAPDASQGDKSAPAPTPSTEVATIPRPSPAAPAPERHGREWPRLRPGRLRSALTLTAPNDADDADATDRSDADQATQRRSAGPMPDSGAGPARRNSRPRSVGPDGFRAGAHARRSRRPRRQAEQIYVVKITDSYKKIAHAHHITVAQLKEANHIKTDVLHTGQKLVIPSGRTVVAENAPASATALDSSPTGPILSESAAPIDREPGLRSVDRGDNRLASPPLYGREGRYADQDRPQVQDDRPRPS